jgi:hypothetical protein
MLNFRFDLLTVFLLTVELQLFALAFDLPVSELHLFGDVLQLFVFLLQFAILLQDNVEFLQRLRVLVLDRVILLLDEFQLPLEAPSPGCLVS